MNENVKTDVIFPFQDRIRYQFEIHRVLEFTFHVHKKKFSMRSNTRNKRGDFLFILKSRN